MPRKLFALGIGTVCLALLMPATLIAQEPTATGAEPAAQPVSASEVAPFMGYWMLEMKFGDNDVRMGLIVERRRDGSGGAAAKVVSSFFGELEGGNLRKEGEALSFDVNAAFGQITVDVEIGGKNAIAGHLADDQGRLAADFKGTLSDRQAFLRFTTPENETRIQGDGDKMVRLRFARPKTGERDYEQIASLAPGEVVQFLEHAVIKLTTEYELRFGDLAVPTENIAADYAGVYGLWLKRTGKGWSLVFNHKADVWGTQYDPDSDLGEVPLEEGSAAEPSETLMAKMEEGESGGSLVFTWGEHTWSTAFQRVVE
ncbi:MAG: DUF2911 domain-containing protein [Acidobacteriota bacterium]|nr:DUF2911 domain-containing protein [Acidobacteriota bacterium]